MRVSLVRLLVAAVVLTLGVGCRADPPVAAPPKLSEGTPRGAWKPIDAGDGFSVRSVDFSSQWPSDPFVIVSGSDDQHPRTFEQEKAGVFAARMRSSDGGVTWERLPQLAGNVSIRYISLPTPHGRIMFGDEFERGTDDQRRQYVVRSADGGVTWTRLSAPSNGRLGFRLVFSPIFPDDGHIFWLTDGTLFRSRDFGETWAQILPVSEQRVQQLEISPSFASDRTVVAAVVTGVFPVPWRDGDEKTVPHHQTSAGIVISTDGGDSWQPASTGLAVDGSPYRYVQQLAISPSFAQDGVLFAFAWGPWAKDAIPSALFRSSDRGQTWAPVWQNADGKNGLRWGAAFALSPGFGADGVGQIALLGTTVYQAGPNSTPPCLVFGTGDSGQSWNLMPRENARSPGCTGLKVAASGPTSRLWYTLRFPGDGRRQEAFRSTDDGKTWEFIVPPARTFPGGGYWPYTITPDGAFMVGTSDGAWMLPPPAAAAPASSP